MDFVSGKTSAHSNLTARCGGQAFSLRAAFSTAGPVEESRLKYCSATTPFWLAVL